MLGKIGSIFNFSKSKNKSNELGCIEKCMIKLSKHPLCKAILLFVWMSILYCVLKYFFDVSSKENKSDNSQPSFTLFIFIFPLVMTFMNRFFKGKVSDEAVQKMYTEISGWQLIIFSSVLQAITYVIGDILFPAPDKEKFYFTMVAWIVINLLLFLCFLYKTMQFLLFDKQMQIITKYIIYYIRTENPEKIKEDIKYSDIENENSEVKQSQTPVYMERIAATIFRHLDDALEQDSPYFFEMETESLVKNYQQIEATILCLIKEEEKEQYKYILNVFIEQLRSIPKQLIAEILKDASYYKTWCGFYPKVLNLHQQEKQEINFEVIDKYLKNHYFIWVELLEWLEINNKDNKLNQRQTSCIKYFIGSWELWKNHIKESEAEILCNHLENTSYMVISALKNNNQEAIKWAIDALVYWHENFFDGYQHEYYNWQNEIITPELFFDPEKLVANSTRNADNLKKDINQLKEIITKIEDKKPIAFFNYWIDIKLLTAAYIMSCPDIKDSKDYIITLLNNYRLEDNTTDISRGKISNVNALLDAYLRQSNCWIKYDFFYDNIFSKHLDNLARIEQPEWIIGRGYSGTGTTKDKYLISFYQVIGISLTTSEFSFHTWQQLLKKENIPDYLNNIKDSLRKLTNINDDIITKVREYFNIEEEEANKRKEVFENSINKFIKQLQGEISKPIVTAKIDKQKLLNLALGASEDTFTIKNGPLPINLFKDIEYTENFTKELYKIIISNFHKIDICKKDIPGKATLQDDKFKDCIAKQVTIKCFEQLLDNINNLQENKFANNLSLLEQAVEDSKKIEQPIMFISSLELWKLLDLNKYKLATTEQKLPFNIVTETGRGGFYICHVENIAVYKYPYKNDNFSILVPQEIFKKITVKKFDENRYVDVNFNQADKNAITGDLIVEFGIDCKFDYKLKVYAFKYVTDESEN